MVWYGMVSRTERHFPVPGFTKYKSVALFLSGYCGKFYMSLVYSSSSFLKIAIIISSQLMFKMTIKIPSTKYDENRK